MREGGAAESTIRFCAKGRLLTSKSSIFLVVLVIAGLLLPPDVEAFDGLPAGFVDRPVVGGVSSPTAIAWLPNGQVLITSQQGRLYHWPGAGDANLALDLSSEICSGGEMGLLGLAVDPHFESGERFIYLYYTDRKGSGACSNAANRANRVSRFSVDQSLTVANETVLIDNIAARGGNHNGGDLQFDKHGLLYISVGDGGEDLITGKGQNQNENARRLSLLNGKILRIETDGSIPNSNPFTGSGTAPCASTGHAPVAQGKVESEIKNRKARKRKRQKRKKRQLQNASICREIFATGLRNPYRIAFDPDSGAANQRFFINDVGGGAWEEIDEGNVGADYGWNVREGPCAAGSTSNCAPDGRFTEPVFAYTHAGGCRTITGGAFVPDDSGWPAEFLDAYFYADFICGRIFAYRGEMTGEMPFLFGTNMSATHLAFGPDNALYYTTFQGGGQVRRIVFDG